MLGVTKTYKNLPKLTNIPYRSYQDLPQVYIVWSNCHWKDVQGDQMIALWSQYLALGAVTPPKACYDWQMCVYIYKNLPKTFLTVHKLAKTNQVLPRINQDSEGYLSKQFPCPCLTVPVYLAPISPGWLAGTNRSWYINLSILLHQIGITFNQIV